MLGTQTPPRTIEDEVEYWRRMGVAVVAGQHGHKDSWPKGWPRVPHADACAATAASVARGPRNLAIRLGETTKSRYLAHLDFDGKCPCGSDLDDHVDGSGPCVSSRCREANQCSCVAYAGIRPEIGLAMAVRILPDNIGIVRTGRGFHVIIFSVREIA